MQYAFPLLAIFIWAGNTVINKLAVGAIFPAEIGFYRWLLAGLLFTPFMLRKVIAHWPQIRPNLGKIFILGVLGMAVYQSLAYFAATMTTATNMGIILSLMPLMSLAMAIISLGQRLTAGALVGAVLSFAGVLVVVSSGSLGALLQHGVNLGDAMMLIATLAYAIYSTLLKKMAAAPAAAGVAVFAGAGGGGGAVSAVRHVAENRPDPAEHSAGAVRVPAGLDARAAGLDAGSAAPRAEPDHAVLQPAAVDHRADCSGGIEGTTGDVSPGRWLADAGRSDSFRALDHRPRSLPHSERRLDPDGFQPRGMLDEQPHRIRAFANQSQRWLTISK